MSDFKRPGLTYLEGAAVAPLNRTMREIQEAAAESGRSVGIKDHPSIAEIVSAIGGRIHYEDLDLSKHTGTIYVHGPDDFDIVLPEFQAPTRERFTLAHELGHYYLHARAGKTRIIAPRLPAGEVAASRLEWEANWFAAGFLMPDDLFRVAHTRLGGSPGALAAEFRVSPKAAEIRAQVLGLTRG